MVYAETYIAQHSKVFKLAHHHKIRCSSFNIIGLPEEERSDILDTIMLNKKINQAVIPFSTGFSSIQRSITKTVRSIGLGKIIDNMNKRKAEMINMIDAGAGKTRLIFHAPSRGLIGYQSRFMTQTRGTGVLNRTFHSYGPFKSGITGRINGALISMETGPAVAFAIFNLQQRGEIFIGHNTEVYKGMICGEHNRDNDLEVNFLKGKKLTNMRTQGTDENVVLTPPRQMSLEEKMAYINDDEVLEVTPKHLRLRKKYLDPHERKRMAKTSSQNI